MPKPVNLAEKLSQFNEHWSPKIIADFNGNDVMVVKVQGAFDWHKHDDTDDMFLVLDGELVIETENGNVPLKTGEMYVVPKGVMHRPVAEKEAHVLLLEPAGTPNTGDDATAAVKEKL